MLDYEPPTYSDSKKAKKAKEGQKSSQTDIVLNEPASLHIAREYINDLLMHYKKALIQNDAYHASRLRTDMLNYIRHSPSLEKHFTTDELINRFNQINIEVKNERYQQDQQASIDEIIINTRKTMPTEKGIIRIPKQLDVMHALRKLAGKRNLLIARAVLDSPLLTLSDLRLETGFETNDLNHSLTALKEADIVLKVENRYTLTIFGGILLEAIDRIYNEAERQKSGIYKAIESQKPDESLHRLFLNRLKPFI